MSGQGLGGVWRCAGAIHPLAHQPHQTFLPCFCGLIHHLLNCCSGRSHWNREIWALALEIPLTTRAPPSNPICSLEWSVLHAQGWMPLR